MRTANNTINPEVQKRRFALALIVLLFTTSAFCEIEYKGTSTLGIESLYKHAKSSSGATSREEEGYVRIKVKRNGVGPN